LKTLIIVACIILLLLLSAERASGYTGSDANVHVARFQEIAEKWMNAYNSSDAENLTPLYTEDAEYISSHVAGLVALGRENVISNFRTGMKQGGHIDSIKILSVNTSSSLATVLCMYNATNSGQKAAGRTLLVLKKINGRWLIRLHMTVV